VSVQDLIKRFPQSRWISDAKALELQVRQNAGQAPRPEAESDEELKLLAIQGLRRDPQSVRLDVEAAVAFPAPIGRAQQQRLVAHGSVEFEEAAGARIAPRPEPVGNGIGNFA